jgi:hypothetical protein
MDPADAPATLSSQVSGFQAPEAPETAEKSTIAFEGVAKPKAAYSRVSAFQGTWLKRMLGHAEKSMKRVDPGMQSLADAMAVAPGVSSVDRARRVAEAVAVPDMLLTVAVTHGIPDGMSDRDMRALQKASEGASKRLSIVGLKPGETVEVDASARMLGFLSAWRETPPTPTVIEVGSGSTVEGGAAVDSRAVELLEGRAVGAVEGRTVEPLALPPADRAVTHGSPATRAKRIPPLRARKVAASDADATGRGRTLPA